MGIDEDTLSVIFGESLPQEAAAALAKEDAAAESSDAALHLSNVSSESTEPWEYRLLERVAQELGILVHQLSEHPGAFSTYRRAMEVPEYAGSISPRRLSFVADTLPTSLSESSSAARFAPSFPVQQQSNIYSEAALWGIEEEPEEVPLEAFRSQPTNAASTAEELAREQEYWERELDVKMVFNFLVKRFSSRRSNMTSPRAKSTGAPTLPRRDSASAASTEAVSARRAAIIRQNHPLVGRNTDRVPTSSSHTRDIRRKEAFRQQVSHPTTSAAARQTLRSSSSCASQSTKKSKRSSGSGRHFWDMSGSVGSGSVLAAEV
jgi:hypothetical protein